MFSIIAYLFTAINSIFNAIIDQKIYIGTSLVGMTNISDKRRVHYEKRYYEKRRVNKRRSYKRSYKRREMRERGQEREKIENMCV